MSPRSALPTAAALLAIAATVAGCAHDDQRQAVGGRVTVELTEFHISPDTIRARPGRLTLLVRNRGRLPHRFALGRGHSAVGDPPVIAPGHSALLRLRLPPGHYRMFDALSNNDTLGMYGQVTVK